MYVRVCVDRWGVRVVVKVKCLVMELQVGKFSVGAKSYFGFY